MKVDVSLLFTMIEYMLHDLPKNPVIAYSERDLGSWNLQHSSLLWMVVWLPARHAGSTCIGMPIPNVGSSLQVNPGGR